MQDNHTPQQLIGGIQHRQIVLMKAVTEVNRDRDLLRNAQDLLLNTRYILVGAQDLLVIAQDHLVIAQDLLVIAQDLLVIAQDLFVNAQDLLGIEQSPLAKSTDQNENARNDFVVKFILTIN